MGREGERAGAPSAVPLRAEMPRRVGIRERDGEAAVLADPEQAVLSQRLPDRRRHPRAEMSAHFLRRVPARQKAGLAGSALGSALDTQSRIEPSYNRIGSDKADWTHSIINEFTPAEDAGEIREGGACEGVRRGVISAKSDSVNEYQEYPARDQTEAPAAPVSTLSNQLTAFSTDWR